MTREQTREAAAVMLAWAEGKPVQYWDELTGKWEDSGHPPDWDWWVTQYRIKPTVRLRPWTADEVPLGAWLRDKDEHSLEEAIRLIVGVLNDNHRRNWLSHCEHSLDKGKTWLPCGVEEGVE